MFTLLPTVAQTHCVKPEYIFSLNPSSLSFTHFPRSTLQKKNVEGGRLKQRV